MQPVRDRPRAEQYEARTKNDPNKKRPEENGQKGEIIKQTKKPHDFV